MARFLVERSFDAGLVVALDATGARACLGIVDENADEGVTWLHSYVTPDAGRTYCVYDGPDPESIRRAASRNGLPVDRITEVQVLVPYFYRPTAAGGYDVTDG
jgi:Protein of unknown function (DUF4242)